MANGNSTEFLLGKISQGVHTLTGDVANIKTQLDDGKKQMEHLTTVTSENRASITKIETSLNGNGNTYVTLTIPFLNWPMRVKRDRVGIYAILVACALVWLYPLLKSVGIVGDTPLTKEDLLALAQDTGSTNNVVVHLGMFAKKGNDNAD